jgi:hypothetical protein
MDCRASNGHHPRPAVRRRPLRQVLPHSSEQQAVARHHTPVLGPPGEAPPPGYWSCTPTGRFRGHGRGPLSAKSGIRGHPRGAKGGIFRAGTGRNGVFWSRSTVWQPTGRPPNPAARCSHRKYRDGEIPRAALNLLHLAVEISVQLARVCVRSRPIPACADRALAGNRDRSVQQRPTSLERPRGRHR